MRHIASEALECIAKGLDSQGATSSRLITIVHVFVNRVGNMARRKITRDEADDMDADALPNLTPQQMQFVEGLLGGKTATDAYKAAYDCSSMGANSIWVEASRLRANSNIALWLSMARQAHLGAGILTLEGHLRELDRLKELCINGKNYGAAVQAEQLRGKASGHYVEQFRDLTDDDPLKTLTAIAAIDPELARRLAALDGIPWQATRH